MHTILVTGASKGIGQAIVEGLTGSGKRIICVSRHQPEWLAKAGEHIWHPLDLADIDQVEASLPTLFAPVLWHGCNRAWLINNAGAIAPVKRIGNLNAEGLARNMALNLTVPMLLANAFVHALKDAACPKLVVNISSGAAKRPIDGWSAYCSAKAGLEMATRALALEQGSAAHPVRALSFAPGIVDTGMQAEIRSAAPEDFAAVKQFIAYKEEGKLASPEAVAEVLLRFLEEDAFESGASVDYRELLKR
jgi:benzil reductase ((S)-benzoin forming)